MEKEIELRLEYKRKFLLQNIADVKNEWYQHDNYREKLRFWFLGVWFGTLAIYLKGDSYTFNLSILLAFETLVFYFFDAYYLKLSRFKLSRISVMEHWIMSASDEEILALEGPLALVVQKNFDLISMESIGRSFLSKQIVFLYGTFLVISLFIKLILMI